MTRLGPWQVGRMLGRDLSGTYHAARRDDGELATLYVLSDELVAMRREPLAQLVALHRELSHPGLVRFRDVDRDGTDLYLIAAGVDDALAVLRGGVRPAPGQVGALGVALAAALTAAHDRGLVHGSLGLDNVLWAPGQAPQILGTGVAALGITDRAALARGDVAALGRLLYALLAGREPPGEREPGSDLARHGWLGEIVRLLADPAATISMSEAHALLCDGEPTHTERITEGLTEQLALRDDLPRRVDTGEVTGPAGASAPPPPPGGAPAGLDPIGGQVGRYRILTRLGRGGMGEVFLAEDPLLRRSVAIKRIRPDLDYDRTFRARLRREAQLAAHLNHRAIVQVFDLVTHGDIDHLVMEYVSGPSLHTLLGGGQMAAAAVVRIAGELAGGLAYAHQQGIIHRDLKLENVLVGTDGQFKIADFGVARRIAADPGDTPEAMHLDGFTVGTSRAVSPEQLEGADVDVRADLFSFGVMLYEMVTGTSPFISNGKDQTLLRVLHYHQPPAHELVPDVPRALSELIDQLLEKRPARRPSSARVLHDRLRSLEASSEPRTESPRSTAPAHRPRATGRTAVANPAGRERRQVTLVCIDLIATGGLTDPELLAEVLPAFRDRADEILARFDGILISAFDHRFAVCFGHPRPHEDAARRAVLAGRALLEAAAELRAVDPIHARARFAARAAVHTGLAVAHGGGAGEQLVLGATLDAALRLLDRSGAGDLWLSGSTARLVEADFQLERLATPTDGVTLAHRIVGPRASSGTGSGEPEPPMVGREPELARLLASWQRARGGQGQVVLVVGDPGIGKSRLARELATAIAGDAPRQIVLRGSADRQRSALEPAAEAIAALLGAGGDDVTLLDRIRALTGPGEAELILRFLGRAPHPAAGPPEGARHQLLGCLRDVLIGPSRAAPTLILVEDLHWLDPSTLDLLGLIVKDVAASQLLVVMTARPGGQPPWPAAATVTQLRLDRLADAAIDAVISHACADRALPATERALIAARAQGVPLYARELVRAALELGHIGEVPSTLRDALTARLHQLGSSATWVAQIAAVAGREFTAGLIAQAGGLDRAAVEQDLDRLVAAEILVRRKSRARELLYQFGHALLQQAAYEALLAADRRHLHGQLADALFADERAGRDPGPELIAHHLAGARRFYEAVASAHRAAHRALERHARVENRELLRQALTWLDQLPDSEARDRTEIGLRMELNAALITTEGYTSAELERSCRRAGALCERHDDMPFPVGYGLWSVHFMSGSPAEAEPFLGRFTQVIDQDGPPVERLMAHVAFALHACSRARYAEGMHHFERSMALFVPAEHAGVVKIYGGCGGFYGHIISITVLWKLGRFAEAWRCARSTVAMAEALDPYALGTALISEMLLHIAAGDVAQAEANAGRIHDLATRYELSYVACWALCGRGWVRARRGQAERAMADLITGNEGIQRIGVKVYSPHSLALLVESAIALGQFDRAERALDDALEVCRTRVDASNEPDLLCLRGHLILGRDGSAHAAARAAFSEALLVAQRHGARGQALRAATDLAALLRDDHLPDEAMAVLGPVYRGFAPDLDEPGVADARKLLAQLSADAG
jgi:class 3 adenylate cyclase/tetratricopeptide (TPR) repeat protein/predicted Ser/Thr protein kinase